MPSGTVLCLIKSAISFVGIAGLVLLFQNCSGDMSPLKSQVQLQGLYDAASASDATSLPGLLSTDSLYVSMKNSVYSVNKTPLFADAVSIVVAVDRTRTGTIVDLVSGAGGEETKIVLSDNQIFAEHLSDPSNYSALAVPLPATGDRMVLSISLGTEPEDIVILVNGLKQTGTMIKKGSPYTSSYLLKTMTLGGTQGSIYGLMIYNRALTPLNLNTLARYVANTNGVSNVVYDPSLGDGTGGIPVVATAQFIAAKAILDGNCLGCHNGTQTDFRGLTQSQFIQKGLVSAGNKAASPIYYRLSGALAGQGPMNMPQNAAALSASQIQIVADWIESIN